ncbi:MAG: substrate-binding domain-containing protein [Oscillospiraceae bacterium]|nr:substrate-binding domain-containing protein [Oscillospiraceae bacterium]
MKRIITILLAVLMVLAACSDPAKEPQEPQKPGTEESSANEEPEPAKPEEPEEPPAEAPAHLDYLRKDFPIIDGSTSLIPLEAGIRAAIFGKTIAEATKDVSHTSTWGSFYELVRGKVDLVFSCPVSEEQRQSAKELGITFEEIPVAYEGFVFVVNAKNPVEVLTQEQLRDIYSGKITNWKEVGGNDAEIIAYQRNRDSGSQNYMLEFMGEVPLMDAPTEGRPSSMVGLMDAIAMNSNAENAIGYSVYAYAADMYSGGDGIKFIKVDGAEVNKNNMANGSYPLLGYNYAVFNSDEPEDSNVRKLVDWMISDEGQLAIAKAGYVTVRDIGFDYSEEKFEIYEGTGTGKVSVNEKVPSFEYTLGEGYIPLELKKYPDGTETYYLNDLADKNLEAEINDFIFESIKICKEKMPQMKEELETAGKSQAATKRIPMESGYELYGPYRDIVYKKGQPASCYVSAKNGYLSVAVTMDYLDLSYYEEGWLNYHTEAAVWDMETGKRLSTEELFREGTDIAEILGEYMTLAIYQPVDDLGAYYNIKGEFASMPKEGWCMTADNIFFDYDNPYFEGGAMLETDTFLDKYMVTSVPNDMEGYFAELSPVKYFRNGDRNIIYKKVEEDSEKYGAAFGYAILRDAYKHSEKINKAAEKYVKENFSFEALSNNGEKDFYKYWDFPAAKVLGDKYFIIIGESLREGGILLNDKTPTQIFNIETGKRIEFSDMLTKSGRKRAKAEGWAEYDEIKDFGLYEGKITVVFGKGATQTETVILAEEDIKW